MSEPWEDINSAAMELYFFVNDLPLKKALEDRLLASADDDVHDDFFHIRRVDGNRPEVFFRMVVWANWTMFRDVEESPFQLSVEKLDVLDHAFKSLECHVLGVEITPSSRVKAWRSTSGPHRSMQRWIRGHQIFAALTQGLIVAFSELQAALAEQDPPSIAKAVELSVVLLRGSGASLEFTGDMPSEDYVNVVRPSMIPPLVPDTFSGLLSTDHRRFVNLLREMKPALDSLHELYPADHQRIAEAVQNVYDSHKFVCERLVGKSPSLMMSAASPTSGGDQIERFKKRRMKVFETGAQPPIETKSA